MADQTIGEEWMDVVGYDGIYRVSSLGRVMSVRRVNHRGLNVAGVMLSQSHCGKYKSVSLCRQGIRRTMNVHRIVAEAFLANSEGRHQVNHIDGNKHNNCVSNLEWCSPSENANHAIGIGNWHIGHNHPNSTLSGMSVRVIRHGLSMGLSGAHLAREFGVSESCISRIKLGKRHCRFQSLAS